MNEVALKIFSYFDTGSNPSKVQPERFYHGFVLGLLVDLKGHLSDLSLNDANTILKEIAITKPNVQCAKRNADYMQARVYYENILRNEFQKKGGLIYRQVPHYMVVEHSPWLSTWYENCSFIKIPMEEFDLRTVSFTYGDSHPTFSDKVNDGKEYRKKLYTYDEILEIIEKYGLPQDWNDDVSSVSCLDTMQIHINAIINTILDRDLEDVVPFSNIIEENICKF